MYEEGAKRKSNGQFEIKSEHSIEYEIDFISSEKGWTEKYILDNCNSLHFIRISTFKAIENAKQTYDLSD